MIRDDEYETAAVWMNYIPGITPAESGLALLVENNDFVSEAHCRLCQAEVETILSKGDIYAGEIAFTDWTMLGDERKQLGELLSACVREETAFKIGIPSNVCY